MQKAFYPKLIYAALLTAPLMALFSFTQMYVIVQVFNALNPDAVKFPELNTMRIIGAAASIVAVSFLFWVINIGLVYWEKSLHWNIHRVWRYVFSFILVIGLGIIIQTSIGEHRPIQTPYSSLIPFLGIIVVNSFILVLIDLIITRNRKAQLELDKAYLEVSNLVASQKHLKSQIHPHFLFNALATLQILISTAPDQAKVYLGRLSNFLRSSVSTTDKDVASITDELQVFIDYMELQRVRFQEGMNYEITIPDAVRNHGYLPVFTLQMLAENAIQHNGFSEEKPMSISLQYEEGGYLLFSNTRIPKYSKEPSTGIGLQNLSKRFELMNADSPAIISAEEEFSVKVQVLDKETAISWT